jgi:hypothetical protein
MKVDKVVAYRERTERLARLNPPSWFASGAGADRKAAAAWMVRNDIDGNDVRSAAFTAFVAMTALSIALAILLWMVLPIEQMAFACLALLMLPALAPTSLLSFARQRVLEEERAILRDSPSVIGMLSMSINVRPSLEGAVSTAAQGDGLLNHRLRASWWEAMSGRAASLEHAVMDLASSVGEMNEGFRQALVLTIASTKQGTRAGIDRLLDRANWLVLEGVREKGDRYVASLSVPTMVLFAFGVLLPVMLFSLMPLLSVSTGTGPAGFAPPPLSVPVVALLMLVIFPACTFAYAQGILRRHPFGTTPDRNAIMPSDLMVVTSLVVVAMTIIIVWPELGAVPALLLLAYGTSAWFILRLHRWSEEESKRPRAERELVLALFLIGNHLASGGSFETALTELARGKEGMARELCHRLLHQVRCDRERVSKIVEEDALLLSVSPTLRQAFSTVVQCGMVDPRAATRTALNLAQYLSDLQATESKVRERLQGVVDMMSYTASFFAPIVLAVSASLFQVVSVLTGSGEGQEGLMLIGGIYTLELCAVVTYFNHMMVGKNDPRGAVYRFARKAPVAISVYVVTFLVAQQGLVMIA